MPPTPEQEDLLLAIHQATLRHDRSERPDGRSQPRQTYNWDVAQELGPRVRDLWPCVDGAERMRLHRALKGLEAAGLVELGRPWGDKATNVKLTARGRELAQTLARADTPP
jgi:hypothetical protein